ncbi:MAG: hypothetical protein FWG91_02530 [Lachnospiraceae bacterium]|nr:hypothetical protein [Lachnospiraceae bacterium]
MRNYRKLLAIILATTLALSLGLTALASQSVTNITNSGEVTGSGSVWDMTFDDKALVIVLPTGKMFDFILDPKGILEVEEGAYYNPNDFNGTVTFKHGIAGDGKLPTIISESSVDVALDITITAVDTNEGDSKINWVTAGAFDEKSGDSYNNDLQIKFFASKDGIEALATSGSYDTASDFQTDGAFRFMDDGEAKLSFILDAVSWKYKALSTQGAFQFEKEQTDDTTKNAASGTQIFAIGEIGTKGTWMDYTGDSPKESISIRAKFDVAEFTGDKKDLTAEANAKFMYEEVGLTVVEPELCPDCGKASCDDCVYCGDCTCDGVACLCPNCGTYDCQDACCLDCGELVCICPEEAFVYYFDNIPVLWVGVNEFVSTGSPGGITSQALVSDLTIALGSGTPVTLTGTQFGVTNDNWIQIYWDSMVEVFGLFAGWGPGAEYTITFTYDGTDYLGSYVVN